MWIKQQANEMDVTTTSKKPLRYAIAKNIMPIADVPMAIFVLYFSIIQISTFTFQPNYSTQKKSAPPVVGMRIKTAPESGHCRISGAVSQLVISKS